MTHSSGESFGETLRRLRRARNLSQPELARLVPISQSSLSRYESGKQVPDPVTASRIDDILGGGGQLQLGGANLSPEDVDRIAKAVDQPHRVDAGVVAGFAQVLAAQRRLDDTLGPRLVIPAVMTQLEIVRALVRQSDGPHRVGLATVLAEWIQFAGWLHAEIRDDATAIALLAEAANAADEVDNPELAAQASNFMGWLSRQRRHPRGVIRWFLSAHHTPGANLHQRIGDAAQAAAGFGAIGELSEAKRLLGEAERLLENADSVPAPVTAYWLDTNFHRLNLGLAFSKVGETAVAAEHLSGGLAGLPGDQQGAEWTREYRTLLAELS